MFYVPSNSEWQEGDRLTLRNPECSEDIAKMLAIWSHPTFKHLFHGAFDGQSYDEDWLRKFASRQMRGNYVMIAKDEQSNILGSIHVVKILGETLSIGWYVPPELRGRGVASLAVTAAMGLFFEDASIRKIVAEVDPVNVASMKLVERLGFDPLPSGNSDLCSFGSTYEDQLDRLSELRISPAPAF